MRYAPGLALAALVVQPAAAGVCLNVKSIKSSDINKDGSAITFKMNDGKIYRNDLKGSCPDMVGSTAFAWSVKNDTVLRYEPA